MIGSLFCHNIFHWLLNCLFIFSVDKKSMKTLESNYFDKIMINNRITVSKTLYYRKKFWQVIVVDILFIASLLFKNFPSKVQIACGMITCRAKFTNSHNKPLVSGGQLKLICHTVYYIITLFHVYTKCFLV